MATEIDIAKSPLEDCAPVLSYKRQSESNEVGTEENILRRTYLDDDLLFLERLRSLTRTQILILDALADGLLNKQIAFDMGVRESTVKAHVCKILQRLQVHTRVQAAVQFAVFVERSAKSGRSLRPSTSVQKI